MLESRTNDIPQPCDEERILAAHFTGKKRFMRQFYKWREIKHPVGMDSSRILPKNLGCDQSRPYGHVLCVPKK
jgi:hypothetical protein